VRAECMLTRQRLDNTRDVLCQRGEEAFAARLQVEEEETITHAVGDQEAGPIAGLRGGAADEVRGDAQHETEWIPHQLVGAEETTQQGIQREWAVLSLEEAKGRPHRWCGELVEVAAARCTQLNGADHAGARTAAAIHLQPGEPLVSLTTLDDIPAKCVLVDTCHPREALPQMLVGGQPPKMCVHRAAPEQQVARRHKREDVQPHLVREMWKERGGGRRHAGMRTLTRNTS
jgi:hypothetical protein